MRPIFSVLAISFSLVASAATIPDRFETIARQADKARSQERVPEAIGLYREGTKLRPSWFEGWWYLGTLLYDQDRFSEAGAAFEHLLASTRHHGPAFAFLGLCEYETGNYDSALERFRSWARAGWGGTPEFRDVAEFHFALLLTREGRFAESLFLMGPLAQRLGNNPELSEAMGLASLRMRSLPEDYPPNDRERVWLAGRAALYAALSTQDFPRANEYATRLESRYGTQPEVHYFRATLYGLEGQNDDAEREYRQELKISPLHVPSLTAIAAMDLERGNLAEAGELARRAVDADSGNPEAHDLAGRVLLANGDLQASLRELEMAKRIAPGNSGVRGHLAMVYSKLGRTQEAKAESDALLLLTKKEEVMAPAEVKLGESREKVH